MRPRSTSRRVLAIALVLGALMSTVACTSGQRGPSPDVTRTRLNGPVPVLPPPSPTPPVPTGRVVSTAADFDRDPCAVATSDELRLALAEPFHVLSGNVLLVQGRPTQTASSGTDTVGCGFGFLAKDTDTAETYHSVVIRVARWRAGGAALLSACRGGPKTVPYGPVSVGDAACLARGSVLTVQSGSNYFTITTVPTPVRADRTNEDTELAPLVRTAATVITPRLPRT